MRNHIIEGDYNQLGANCVRLGYNVSPHTIPAPEGLLTAPPEPPAPRNPRLAGLSLRQFCMVLNVKYTMGVLFLSSVFVLPCLGQIDAVSRARHDLKLGFTVPGRVLNRFVHPGDRVKTGERLIELEDKEGLAQIEIWQFRSQSTVAIEQAQASLELARTEEKRTRELVAKHAAVPFELKRAELTTKVQELALIKAQMEQVEAKLQLEITRARHDSYTLLAPMGGRIELILVDKGEVVENLKPVVQLVVTDPLRVDARVPLEQTKTLKVGNQAWVQSGQTKQIVVGKIIHMAEVADSASDTLLVRVEYPNPQLHTAGEQVIVYLTEPKGVTSE